MDGLVDGLMFVGMILWGVLEYRRRERLHRERIAILRRTGAVPVEIEKQEPWRIGTTVIVLGFVTGVIVRMAWMGLSRQHVVDNRYFLVAVPFVPIAVILIIMIVRDIRRYLQSPQARGQS
jgi:hypothetical protein